MASRSSTTVRDAGSRPLTADSISSVSASRGRDPTVTSRTRWAAGEAGLASTARTAALNDAAASSYTGICGSLPARMSAEAPAGT